MAKLNVHKEGDTPTRAIVEAANQLVHVTDAKGRKIGLRQLPFLEEFRIIETVGPELARNATYMGMLNPLLFIAEIDGEAVGIPRTKIQIDSLIQTAAQEGFVAASLGIKDHFSAGNPELEKQIKNLVGTPASSTDSGS